jgi:MFS family permease
MRGGDKRTGELFSYVDLEKRVRLDHPLRAIRGLVNEALEHEFSALYGQPGYTRTSVATPKLRPAFPAQGDLMARSASGRRTTCESCARPLGGVFMGHIGDCFGRRAALTFSVAAMAISTFLIGLLPGYRTIGMLAPVGLTLLSVVR